MSAARISPEDLDELITNGVDLYALLGLDRSSDIPEREVRRSYRQKALIYHPDKNPSKEARQKFEQISKALEILTQAGLKKQYDDKLNAIAASKIRNEKLSKNLQDLRINLQQNEQKARESVTETKRKLAKVEALKADGLRRKRFKEQQRREKSANVTSAYNRDYQLKYLSKPPLLQLKWKVKQDLPDLLSNGVISQIMELFGDISEIQSLERKNSKSETRYQYCLIQYKDFDGFHRALRHDYSKTSDYWNGSGLRRLSSLLRGVEVYNEKNSGDRVRYFEDYFDEIVTRMNG